MNSFHLDLARQVCAAFGLDPAKTRSITIRLSANDIAAVEVVQFVTAEEGKRLVELIKRYELAERSDDETR